MNPETKKYIDDKIREHIHDGNYSQRVNLFDIFVLFKTITSATTLTNTLAASPTNIYEQLFIDTSTATKKLYIYDVVGDVWRSTIIT